MGNSGVCAKLSAVLGHRFVRPELLAQALTHSSAATRDTRSLERLEFLGDRVLGLVIASMLIRRFPGENQGALAQRLAQLVSHESLVRVADKLDLASCVVMQPNVDPTDLPPSVREDVCEAVIGAVFLDGGLETATVLIERLWGPLITAEPPRDAKTELQEWVQARSLPLPVYDIVATEGPPHEPMFTMSATVEGFSPVEARGASKRAAERDAARILLRQVRRETDRG